MSNASRVRALFRYTDDEEFNEDLRRLFMSVGLSETARVAELATFEAVLVTRRQREECRMVLDSVKTIVTMIGTPENPLLYYREQAVEMHYVQGPEGQ